MRQFNAAKVTIVWLTLSWLCTAVSSVSLGQEKSPLKTPLGVVVDDDGRHAYAALYTAGKVAVVGLDEGRVLKEWPVPARPNDLAFAGGELFVSCEQDDCVAILDPATGKQTKLAVGQSPQSVALIDGDDRVFVACRDEKALYAVDTRTGKTQVLPLPGWPSRVVAHRLAGKPYLLVLSTLPGKGCITLVAIGKTMEVKDSFELQGVSNVRGLAVQSFFGSGVMVAHQKPRTQLPTTQLAQGWVFTNEVTTGSMQWFLPEVPRTASVLDSASKGQADPSDLIASPTHKLIFVASAGADRVLALRGGKTFFYKGDSLPFYTPGQNPEDMNFSRFFVAAQLPTGANPRRLALSGDEKTLVVANYLGDSLTVIDVATLKVKKTISLLGAPPDAARRGEILFHSARLTQFGQFTCASCHPGGGSDGLNWDLTRDGLGNFLNTRSLLGVKDTAPYGWHGTSPTLADRITGTLTTLHGYEPTKEEVADLAAYLQTLSPPRPLPAKLLHPEKVARGKQLFMGKAGCAVCHSGPTLQDGKTHNIGTARPGDISPKFDTPSLRGLVYTAPYLHDGRAATLTEVFTQHDGKRQHGQAHELKATELANLVEYLKSL